MTASVVWRNLAFLVALMQCGITSGLYFYGVEYKFVYACMPTSAVLLMVNWAALSAMHSSEVQHKEERKKMAQRIFDETQKRIN